ncbi:peptide chain release factor 2 [bacterium]|nr:peptide chain release factor 2 [bacterium]
MLEPREISLYQDKARALLVRLDRQETGQKIQQLEQQTLLPDFWTRPDAKQIMKALGEWREREQTGQRLVDLLDELETAQFLQTEEPDNPDYIKALEEIFARLRSLVKSLELEQYLTGKYDRHDAIFSIHAGQGGTEAMDWASMLARAYTRFFEREGWKYQLLDESRGEEAGIKAVTYEVSGRHVYGLLKHEAGTHRLVRLSPFNADNLRQTSFCLVEVMPAIESDSKDIVLNEADLSWHFTRSGGAGGQNVNKVNTAVELTYLPLGIVVRCREERFQAQNKERALQILRSRLALMQEQQQTQELSALKGDNTQASWGTQIRNYVLHPYQLVKDVRTGVETSDTAGVLDGKIRPFIDAELAQLT